MSANPGIRLPGSEESAFPVPHDRDTPYNETILTTVASTEKCGNYQYEREVRYAEVEKIRRSNFLPDSATRVFYPGWDITYSSVENESHLFYATYGLGSPFVEDSKLCAAVNGMWIAASPDSARTFRGSLTEVRDVLTTLAPPTAIPLLDTEIGFHADGPAFKDYGIAPATGWDGEEGPFIFKTGQEVKINFTDVGRADYARNAIEGKFDMSLMRKITTAEVKFRMECLRRCYAEVPRLKKEYWLVGVEKVEDWEKGAFGHCIPKNIFQGDNLWATVSKLNNEKKGFLYLFGKTDGAPVEVSGSKRMNQSCSALYVFQMSKHSMAYCKSLASEGWVPEWMS